MDRILAEYSCDDIETDLENDERIKELMKSPRIQETVRSVLKQKSIRNNNKTQMTNRKSTNFGQPPWERTLLKDLLLQDREFRNLIEEIIFLLEKRDKSIPSS